MNQSNNYAMTIYFPKGFDEVISNFDKIIRVLKRGGKLGNREDNRLRSVAIRKLMEKFVEKNKHLLGKTEQTN